MTKRRSRGDGGLHWDEKRQRWIATANLGFDPSGKRIVKVLPWPSVESTSICPPCAVTISLAI